MLLKRILYIVSISLFYSCGMTFVIKKDSEKDKEENNRKISSHSDIQRSKIPNSSSEYIEMYKPFAINNMNNYHIPASITLGQGILESSSGKSNLAVDANNHFGIKCGAGWEEMSYYKDDDKKHDCFRVYDDVSKSFSDHSKILMYSRYKKLFDLDIKDYKAWSYGLKECGYATNPKYPEILVAIIERYKLYEYDNHYIHAKNSESDTDSIKKSTYGDVENSDIENSKISVSEKEISETTVIKTITNFITSTEKKKIHKVEKGDTIYNISKKYNVDIEFLKNINELKDNTIIVGQEIIISL